MGRHFEVRAKAMAQTAAKKSAVYMRASKEIYVAAKAGVPDPNNNLALRSAIDKWKSQFDYVSDEDEFLSSSDVGNFCMWQSIGDYIENFIPSFLVYAVLTLNDKDEVVYIKNNNYYDSLSKSQKLKLCKLLRKAYYEYSLEYSEYERLLRRIR